MTGIELSVSTTSNFSTANLSKPSWSLYAVSTWWPKSVKKIEIVSDISLSSSTIKDSQRLTSLSAAFMAYGPTLFKR